MHRQPFTAAFFALILLLAGETARANSPYDAYYDNYRDPATGEAAPVDNDAYYSAPAGDQYPVDNDAYYSAPGSYQPDYAAPSTSSCNSIGDSPSCAN